MQLLEIETTAHGYVGMVHNVTQNNGQYPLEEQNQSQWKKGLSILWTFNR
jgi:hypothetical protein